MILCCFFSSSSWKEAKGRAPSKANSHETTTERRRRLRLLPSLSQTPLIASPSAMPATTQSARNRSRKKRNEARERSRKQSRFFCLISCLPISALLFKLAALSTPGRSFFLFWLLSLSPPSRLLPPLFLFPSLGEKKRERERARALLSENRTGK